MSSPLRTASQQNDMKQSVLPVPIWKKVIKPIDHQLLWWLLDIGAPGQLLMHGWQMEAAAQLGIHRITMRRRVQLLVAAGILIEGKKKGEILLNVRIFDRQADRTKVRMMRVGARGGEK